MNTAKTGEPTPRKPLRLWPGVIAVMLQGLAMFVIPAVVPDAQLVGLVGGVVGALAVAVWWAFFSRAPLIERWGVFVLIVVAMAATTRILHVSIATGAMGYLYFVLVIPGISLAFVPWAVASRNLADGPRRLTVVATILLACGGWSLVRTGGNTGTGDNDLAWRWSETPEERLLAQVSNELVALPPAAAAAEAGARWPGFRGPDRDGISPGAWIATDWSASPPVELWRRPIGPGWSSFAVRGDLLYTQEQRGDDEIVACYSVTTGEPVWRHRDATRFWESNGGAGPRATPTLSEGRVYTFGATGILNALDAGDGTVVWSRNVASDASKKIPFWGFTSSPLVVGEVVIVAAAGRLAAYDRITGEPRWLGADGGGYSSPHLATIDGVAQILQMSGAGVASVAPADGTLLWENPWSGVPIVQPALLAGGEVLISTADAMGGLGTRRLAVVHEPEGWTVEERWTTRGLKPYFNDYVVHKGHAYGFDGSILASIDLDDGTRSWKGGRYGHGQLVLLPDQDLLLVLSEDGELALVAATPDKFTQFARFPAIAGKTWNHPVLIDDVLLVRNGEEMAAFRLPLAGR